MSWEIKYFIYRGKPFPPKKIQFIYTPGRKRHLETIIIRFELLELSLRQLLSRLRSIIT